MFRLIFDQIPIFMVSNFDNNFSKTCYFFILVKTVCKACYNLYINAQICYFYCILGPLWPVTSEATVAPLPLYSSNMGLRSACAHDHNAELLGCLEATVPEKDAEISRLHNEEMVKISGFRHNIAISKHNYLQNKMLANKLQTLLS